jgi:hypothetical protein
MATTMLAAMRAIGMSANAPRVAGTQTLTRYLWPIPFFTRGLAITIRRLILRVEVTHQTIFHLSAEILRRSPWRYKIAATVFWIGEQAAENNPIPNTESAWDSNWMAHYGGEDDPARRVNFNPAGFIPKQNPFYVALPYNDVDDHHTKLEASKVIPWFNDSFVKDGQSVCKGRWVAIRRGKRTCDAQWEDVGPFQINHWQYVFGNERPRANRNQDAGIDVSPAVRDYLGMSGMDLCDWKFVSVYEVPSGPWTLYGDNNTVANLRRQNSEAAPHCGAPRQESSAAEKRLVVFR